ncbi:proline--tRNA ligase [Pueribacillus theae]|uniref:Proline--tRNA ligase n=1 Tax=Pueribacillus theae TaxID=2171751 RepID=A0A2U1K8N2_9BACI|nr:proline--tRNA ligase [Pueribacillus theae]PWA13538.1 proline--tRNA ligase [Pueribacillus theae]
MRQSNYFVPTLREVPNDAEIVSHQLLLRAGFMRQNASGIYSYLPLGFIVLRKIEEIIRDEMNKAGAQELLMPAIQPAELWHETGRWKLYGPELMRLKDRHNRDFALGATHEELITSLVRDEINSYKKMPVLLYQIQTKYRDEKRPRFGLLRGREFIMKDAYSFDSSEEGLDKVYNVMVETYKAIFNRCKLNFRPVVADSGAIGGKDTHEFMALSEVGEDTIAYSSESDFAANVEMAPVLDVYEASEEEQKELQLVEDPESQRESLEKNRIHYTFFETDDKCVCLLTSNEHVVNEIKVKHYFDANHVKPLTVEEAAEKLNVSLHDLSLFNKEIEIYADNAIKAVANGSLTDSTGKSYVNVNPDRDFNIAAYADFRMIQEGDPSPDGQGEIVFARGIEIGQVFKLGTRYSETMNATFLDENGKSKPILMGCYGIGVSRVLATVVEQHHDEKGIVWPVSLSPFLVHLISVNSKNEAQKELSEKLYSIIQNEAIDVLYDDRSERAGVKFSDSDLIGIPIRIIVGKKANEGIVEVKIRKTGESFEVPVNSIIEVIRQQLKILD